MDPTTISDILHATANIIAATAIIPLALFVYFYGTEPVPGSKLFKRWHWRRYTRRWQITAPGRIIMYQKIAWITFLLFVITNLFVPDYGVVEQALRILIYSSLVALFWSVFAVLRKVQKTVEKDVDGDIYPANRPTAEEVSSTEDFDS
jgi:hypothetical protein